MDFKILGPLEVYSGDRPLELGGVRQRALLAMLVLHAGEVVSSERLVAELWASERDDGSPKTLQVAVSRLRRALGSGSVLVTRPPGYQLELEHGQVDLHLFEDHVTEGRRALGAGDPAAAVREFTAALDLWRGAPLADLTYESFAQEAIGRLHELHASVMEDRLAAQLELGLHTESVAELQALTGRYPLRERLREQLMLALYRSGRQADALAVYHDARKALVEQLGLEPGLALQQLERAILAQDPELAYHPASDQTTSAAASDAPDRAKPPPIELEISLLGPPRVVRNGAPVAFDTRKATALLAHLALAERARSREALCDLLWPGQDPEHARAALRRTLSALRKAVGVQWVDTAADSVALADRDGLALDVRRFRSLADEGADADALTEAVAVFRGELLEGFGLRDSPEFEAWQLFEADALQRELAAALGRLVAALVAAGRYAQAVPHARRWLELDPLHEPAHRELIRLYAWTGDRAQALSQYRDCVRTLSQELGVAPIEETAALFEQVSEGTLAPPSQPAASTARAPEPATVGAREQLPLIGRSGAMERLLGTYDEAAADGRLVVIEGEAGIGKTRLIRELAEATANRGARVLAASCHDDEAGLPYGPVLDLLREALRLPHGALPEAAPQRLADAALLLPELANLRDDLPEPMALTGPGAQARLLEGIAVVLEAACSGPTAGVVVIDDVHAADEATLDVLAYLARRLRGRPMLLALTWRSEGVPPGHRLRRLATGLAREGTASLVALARLDEDEVAELVRTVRPGDADLERRLYLESEGLPLFVAEYLTTLEGRGGEPPAPQEMRGLLEARLGDLGAMGRQLLETAAVIGRTFAFDTVRAASGRSADEALDALEALVARGLVREASGPEPSFDFTHDKLRALMYDEVGPARRRLLHRRVAEAIARTARGDESAALIAQHLGLGGDLSAAAEQHIRAGEHAASLLAHADALGHLETALASESVPSARLPERIGDLQTLLGDYAGALASYESSAARAAAADLAGIEQKLGGVHARRGEWERADTRFAVALEAVPAEDSALRARILADRSLALHQSGRSAEAAALAQDAASLAEKTGDRRAQAQAHNLLGVLARAGGDLPAARIELERSLSLAEELDDAEARTAALNNLALVAQEAGELDRALALTTQALGLSEAIGDRHREAALENNLADLHHAVGREQESMEHLKRAVAIFSEVGADEATRLPEIWKLVSW